VGLGAPRGPVVGGGFLKLTVTGPGGLPANATAVALNVTATDTTGAGYISAYPCDRARPTASILNYAPLETVPNLAVVPLAANGTVCLFSSATVDLVVDVAGWFSTAGQQFSAVQAVNPLDSLVYRNPDPKVPLAAGAVARVKVRGMAGVPAAATSVAVVLGAGPGFQAGFLTAYPCDQRRPTASNLNYHPFGPRQVAALVPIAADGSVCVYTYATTFLEVYVLGYFTG
jgi:hypothetical protein